MGVLTVIPKSGREFQQEDHPQRRHPDQHFPSIPQSRVFYRPIPIPVLTQ